MALSTASHPNLARLTSDYVPSWSGVPRRATAGAPVPDLRAEAERLRDRPLLRRVEVATHRIRELETDNNPGPGRRGRPHRRRPRNGRVRVDRVQRETGVRIAEAQGARAAAPRRDRAAPGRRRAERDRVLAERSAEIRREIEQARADATRCSYLVITRSITRYLHPERQVVEATLDGSRDQ
jgi:hypothetical protein